MSSVCNFPSDVLVILAGVHDVSGCTEKYHYKDDWATGGWFERSDCGLTEIPEDIPEDSTFVDLSSNSLVSLDDDAFPSLPNCVRLYLEENTISEIEAGAFSDITLMRINSRTSEATCGRVSQS